MGAETIPLIKADIERNLSDFEAWKEEINQCSPQGGSKLDQF